MSTPITIGEINPVYDNVTGITSETNNISLEVVDDKLEIHIANNKDMLGVALDVQATEILLQTVTIMLRSIYADMPDKGY